MVKVAGSHLVKCVLLQGENVSDERLDTMFQQADQDGSGLIEFEEFVGLMRAMNPKNSVGGAFQSSQVRMCPEYI